MSRLVGAPFLPLVATPSRCVVVRGAWREGKCGVTAVLLSSKRFVGYVSDSCVDGRGKALGDKSAGKDSDKGKNHGLSEHKVLTAGIPGSILRNP